MLERSADSAPGDLPGQLAVDAFAHERDRAGSQRRHAGNEVEGSAFTRAVRTDQANDLAGTQGEADVVHCDQTAKFLADRIDRKNRLTRRGSHAPTKCGRCRGWLTPAPRRRTGQPVPDRRNDRPEAVLRILQHDDQQHAEDDELNIDIRVKQPGGQVLDLVTNRQNDRRPQQSAPDVAGSADDRHEQITDPLQQAERIGADRPLHVCEQPP